MMIKTLLLITLLISPASLAASPAAPAQKAPPAAAQPVVKEPLCLIDVTVEKLRKSGELYLGQICYTLFKGKEGFPDKSELAYVNKCIPVQQAAMLNFTVKELPCNNDYALALLHDENLNRQLDKNLAIPKEGVGMSNNPSFIRVNAPPFEDVKFPLQAPRSVQVIRIHYF